MPESLGRLRALMRRRGVDAYLIPTSDYHDSEYVGAHFKARAYCSGFTGSAGTLALTQSWAGLWTDGRYFLQAEAELAGSGIDLYRMGEQGVPEIPDELLSRMREGGVLGADGRTISAAWGEELREALAPKGITLSLRDDLVGEIWENRPPLPNAPAMVLDLRYAGQAASDKLAALRREMAELGADYHVLTTLDDIAWLFNIRGGDVRFCPVLLAYACIGRDGAALYTEEGKLPPEVKAHLHALGVAIAPYEAVYADLGRLDGAVLLDRKRVNAALAEALTARIIDHVNPTTLSKMVKNGTELSNLRAAHQKDGLALCRFLHRVKTRPEGLTERSAGALLDGLRRETPGYLGPSFATIAAYGEHGAIVHYCADERSDIPLRPEGFLLVDSGGQYYEGTTDVTRTIALGPPTPRQKRDFTLVLQGMLRLSHARFPAGLRGEHLDAIARGPLWAEGLDYRHGTGHGVGYLLNVHEGPVNLRWRSAGDGAVLASGMVLSDEPGLYRAGEYGIRTENQLACVSGPEGEYGPFLAFETLTLAPIDLDAVEPALLSEEERGWLNAYHARVYEALAPGLPGDVRAWLREATRTI